MSVFIMGSTTAQAKANPDRQRNGADERLKVKPYAIANLMARYQLRSGLSAQANGENLFDKKYYSQMGFYDQLAFGEPRNVTITLRYHY
jgi:outer membrane receptor for ferric coprogen and ferric-rhodotorulic acid